MLDDHEKMAIVIAEFQIPGRGGDNGVRIIANEPGMYGLVLQSRKRVAPGFKRWLTLEVILILPLRETQTNARFRNYQAVVLKLQSK